MAAIFCKSLFKPCELAGRGCAALCECVFECCDAVGRCIDSCCEACGQICAPCAECCSAFCDLLARIFAGPLSGCVFFSLLMSVGPLIASIIILVSEWDNHCDHPLHIWVLLAVISFFVDLVFAIYVCVKITLNNNAELDGGSDFKKTMQFIMYDWGVCLFIPFAIFELVWALVGLNWASNENIACDGSKLQAMTNAGAIILLVFFCGGLLVVFCSMCNTFNICTDSCFPNNDRDQIRKRALRQQAQPRQQQPQQQQQQRAASPAARPPQAYQPAQVQGAYVNPNAYQAAPQQQQMQYQNMPYQQPYGGQPQPQYQQQQQYQQPAYQPAGAYPPQAYQQAQPAGSAVVMIHDPNIDQTNVEGSPNYQPPPPQDDSIKGQATAAAKKAGKMAQRGVNNFKDWWKSQK